MDAQLANLIAAATAFVGTHFALSHPLRGSVTGAVGDRGFQAVYSLVALATFAWMVMAFRAVPLAPPLIERLTMTPASWIVATLLMLVASVLLAGSFSGNPALPAPGAAELAARGPHGVFHVTRHPMMWSMALWSISHFLVSPTPRVLVLTLAVALLALVGSHLQDRKKAVQMGAAWAGWEAKTSYWPRLGALGKAGMVPWLGGTAFWLGASWAHLPLAGIPAGLWRWF
ncbi:MAG: MFS transporter [Sphingomonadaceae bacterium]|nr:MFS transporter [Sphingomonadaceae bacterium]